MPYTNTIVTTSTGGTWNGTSISYNSISLIDGIPHSAQLEVERVFTVPRTTGNYSTIEDFLNNPATTQKDKQQVFIIPASRITFNETSKTITAIDLPNSGASVYDFNPDGDGLANVPVPGIVGGAVGIGDIIKIRRKTVSNQTLVEWSAGSKLTSAQLNLEVKQLIYLIQELIDKTTTEVNVSNTAIGTIPNYSITPTKLSAGGPTWTSGGNVGIGTASPNVRLHVHESVSATGAIQLTTTGTGSGATDGLALGVTSSISSVWNYENTPLVFGTNGAERMRIEAAGNLILGNVNAAGDTTRNIDIYNYTNGTSAASILRLITNNTSGAASSIGQIVKYQNSGAFAIQNTDLGAAAHIRFDLGNSEIMRLTSSNRLGLGTDNPSTKLQIAVPSTGTTLTGSNRYGGIHLTQSLTQDEFTGITTSATSNGTQGGILFQGSGAYGTKIHFLTTTDFATGMQNRMTLDAAGKLGIGTGGPSYTLDVVGTGRFSNSTNNTKLLIEGYGNSLAYGIQFTPANDTSTFPCRFHNAAGTLVGSIQTTASTATFNGNASTATKLATPRAINGVNFDGSADITISQSYASGTTIPIGGIIMLTNTSSGTTNLLSTTTITQANITSAGNGVYNYAASGGNVSAGTYTVIGQSVAFYSGALYTKIALVQRTS